MATARRHLALVLSGYIAVVFALLLFSRLARSHSGIQIGSVEPGARWLVGVVETFATILLFFPSTRMLGAVIASAVMAGAIFFPPFSPVGMETIGNRGLMFDMARGAWASACIVLAMSVADFKEWLRSPSSYRLLKKEAHTEPQSHRGPVRD